MVLLKTEIQSILLSQLKNPAKHVLGKCRDELRVRRQEKPEIPSRIWNAAVPGEIIVRGGKSTLGEKLPNGSLPLWLGTQRWSGRRLGEG
jgi:hypothetical protein